MRISWNVSKPQTSKGWFAGTFKNVLDIVLLVWLKLIIVAFIYWAPICLAAAVKKPSWMRWNKIILHLIPFTLTYLPTIHPITPRPLNYHNIYYTSVQLSNKSRLIPRMVRTRMRSLRSPLRLRCCEVATWGQDLEVDQGHGFFFDCFLYVYGKNGEPRQVTAELAVFDSLGLEIWTGWYGWWKIDLREPAAI